MHLVSLQKVSFLRWHVRFSVSTQVSIWFKSQFKETPILDSADSFDLDKKTSSFVPWTGTQTNSPIAIGVGSRRVQCPFQRNWNEGFSSKDIDSFLKQIVGCLSVWSLVAWIQKEAYTKESMQVEFYLTLVIGHSSYLIIHWKRSFWTGTASHGISIFDIPNIRVFCDKSYNQTEILSECSNSGQIFKLFQITAMGSVSREGCYLHRKRSLTGANHKSFAIEGLGGIFLVSAWLGNM